MAKTDPDLNDDTILLDDYVPPAPTKPDEKEGPYDRHVVAALTADEALRKEDPEAYAGGKRKRVSIVVPDADAEKERRLFQDSARFRDRTAKQVAMVEQGDGFTKVSFILIPKQVRPRLTPEEKAARDAEKAAETAAAPAQEVAA